MIAIANERVEPYMTKFVRRWTAYIYLYIYISIDKENVKQSHYRPGQALRGSRKLRLPDFKKIGTRRWQGCQPYAPVAFTPQEIFLVLISVRG